MMMKMNDQAHMMIKQNGEVMTAALQSIHPTVRSARIPRCDLEKLQSIIAAIVVAHAARPALWLKCPERQLE
jgi:hypothetical protein